MDTEGTLMESLGIEIVSVAKDRIVATMPVDGRTMQPFGYLHGGATAALLETVASLGSIENVDLSADAVFGVELCVHHVRSVREGSVTGTATPRNLEPREHVWEVECRDAEGEVLSTGTCVVRIVPKRR